MVHEKVHFRAGLAYDDCVMTGYTVILKTSEDQVIAIYRNLANEAQATSWAADKIQYWNEQNHVRKTPVKIKALVYDPAGELVSRTCTESMELDPLFVVICQNGAG
jgi:hypothetical protein